MRESSCAAIQRQKVELLRHNRKSIGISVFAPSKFSKASCVCCVASVSVTLLSRAGDLPPWRLIHFDEATDCADAQRLKSPLLTSRMSRLDRSGVTGGAEVWMYIKWLIKATTVFRSSRKLRAITGKTHPRFILFHWALLMICVSCHCTQYLRLWTI